MNHTRRQLITGISLAGTAALLAGCRHDVSSSATNNEAKTDRQTSSEEPVPEVTATEDLMREHGILRRALLVYSEAAAKLKQDPKSVPPDALEKTAQLFRAFGEDYHEKKLEEIYIFPAVQRAQNAASVHVDVLLAQHSRGREITDYLLAMTAGDKIPSASVGSFVTALETFVRMYEHHAAIEDTIVFPIWKVTVGSNELDELGEKFEEIEEEVFGDDGFGAALKRMAEIEESLGLADLGMFTAPPPPAHS